MKLLYLPLNVPGDEQFGTVDGFEQNLGKDNVHVYDYLDQARRHGNNTVEPVFIGKAKEVQPDWIHMQIQSERVITPKSLNTIKQFLPNVVITHWMGDWRAQVPPNLAQICKLCDVSFLSNEGQLPMYKELGAPMVQYWQNAVTEWIDIFPREHKDISFEVPEVVFCGNNYGSAFPGSSQRRAVVEAFARSDLDFGVVGGGWPMGTPVVGGTGPRMQIWIYPKAKVSIGVDNVNDCMRFYSERQLAALAAGTPHVCWGSPGKEKDFTDGEHCIFFGSPEEAVEKTRELLKDPVRMKQIGDAGRNEILDKHIWPVRVQEILPLMRGLVATKRAS